MVLYVGLVQELDLHRDDCATKYLSVPGTYVLVKKQPISAGQDDGETTESSYDYVPLLNDWHQLLPGYRVQRTAAGASGEAARRGRLGPADSRHKSHSPAVAKSNRSKQAKDRAPSRKH